MPCSYTTPANASQCTTPLHAAVSRHSETPVPKGVHHEHQHQSTTYTRSMMDWWLPAHTPNNRQLVCLLTNENSPHTQARSGMQSPSDNSSLSASGQLDVYMATYTRHDRPTCITPTNKTLHTQTALHNHSLALPTNYCRRCSRFDGPGQTLGTTSGDTHTRMSQPTCTTNLNS